MKEISNLNVYFKGVRVERKKGFKCKRSALVDRKKDVRCFCKSGQKGEMLICVRSVHVGREKT